MIDNIETTTTVNGTLVSNLFQLSALSNGVMFEIPCHASKIMLRLEVSENCVRLESDY
jgi:hypothetical protein